MLLAKIVRIEIETMTPPSRHGGKILADQLAAHGVRRVFSDGRTERIDGLSGVGIVVSQVQV